MKAAMILCAGFGTRLENFTKETPKPMLLVNGKPILEYTINHLSKLGIDNIFINLHCFADKIRNYFGDGKNWGVKIRYSFEEEPLGTAGAVKNIETMLTSYENFLVLYGDVVCNQNYIDLYKLHNSKKNAIATIMLHERLKSNSVVEIDSDSKIVRFIERPEQEVLDKKQNWVNSGLYCLNRDILKYIPENVFFDFPKNVFPRLVSEGRLYGYPLQGYRRAVDSPERYMNLQEDFEKKVVSME